MTTTVDAIYENGVLRLKQPIDLKEGAAVRVVVMSEDAPKKRRTPYEIMSEIAALPMEPGGKHFSGRDHDKILYGKPDAK